MYNPYLQGSPYYQPNPQNSYPQISQQQNILPPMQVLTANGKSSIDALKMSPNSSVFIADNTAPIIWKCVSDGLGNVTAEPFDVSPHKDEAQVEQDNTRALLDDMNTRLKRLEEKYEQSIAERTTTEQQYITESRTNQTSVGNAQKHGKPTSNARTDASEQS